MKSLMTIVTLSAVLGVVGCNNTQSGTLTNGVDGDATAGVPFQLIATGESLLQYQGGVCFITKDTSIEVVNLTSKNFTLKPQGIEKASGKVFEGKISNSSELKKIDADSISFNCESSSAKSRQAIFLCESWNVSAKGGARVSLCDFDPAAYLASLGPTEVKADGASNTDAPAATEVKTETQSANQTQGSNTSSYVRADGTIWITVTPDVFLKRNTNGSTSSQATYCKIITSRLQVAEVLEEPSGANGQHYFVRFAEKIPAEIRIEGVVNGVGGNLSSACGESTQFYIYKDQFKPFNAVQ